MRVVLFFIDGIGLGDDSIKNPFYSGPLCRIQQLLEGNRLTESAVGFNGRCASLAGLDASLGVAGLPQSATGQAAIFTGVNAPRLIGSHLRGFPNRKLRNLLRDEGMFRRFRNAGYRCAFANAYRPEFFNLLKQKLPGERYSCSTLITYYGGLRFRNLDDLHAGEALFMDIDNSLLIKMGFNLPLISPEEGGRRLAYICRKYDLTLFEFFLSDLAGHAGEKEEAERIILTLDRFIGAVYDSIDLNQTLLLVTSDHGNLENLAHRDHTENRVPALIIGPASTRNQLMSSLHDLTDILPALCDVLAG